MDWTILLRSEPVGSQQDTAMPLKRIAVWLFVFDLTLMTGDSIILQFPCEVLP
jgi:hypothetical protein